MISSKRVSNIELPSPSIVVIGESPGEEENWAGVPFVGESGKLLRNALVSAGFAESSVSFLNLCQYHPSDNMFSRLHGTAQLSSGISDVKRYLSSLPSSTPILCLGNWPAHFICDMPETGITSYRGYIFPTNTNHKALLTVHPSAVLRDGTLYPLFHLDINKLYRFLTNPPPPDNLNITVINDDITAALVTQQLTAKPQLLFSDIETTKKNPLYMICVGFSDTNDSAYVFNAQDSFQRECIRQINVHENVSLGYHNGIFDTLVMACNGMPIRHYAVDTTIPMHIMEPELPRSLEALVANYTFMDYYKKAGRAALPGDIKEWGAKFNYRDVAIYNGKDCIATRRVWNEIYPELLSFPNGQRLFDYELEDIQVAFDISMNGMPVDVERRDEFLASTFVRWNKRQTILDQIAGRVVNVGSNKDMPKLLYVDFNLPPRTKKGNVTTDDDALISLLAFTKDKADSSKQSDTRAKWEIKHMAIKLIIEIRGLRKLISSYLKCPISPDNRMRSTYKAIGPETGRWAASKFVDKTGVNGQTMPRGKVKIDKDPSTALIMAALSGELPKEDEDES